MPLFGRAPKPQAPFQRELGAFAEKVDRLSAGDVLFLRAAWNELDPAAVEQAVADARAAIEASGRGQVATDMETSLVRWASGSTPPLGTVDWIQEPNLAIDRDTRKQGMEVLRNVGYALLSRDLIAADSFAVLYEPWRALSEGDETDAS
jgi:hypothetical protein